MTAAASHIETRLRDVEDRLAIRELRNRYCAFIDAEQWDEAADLFTEDGAFEGIEVARGKPAIRDWFSRSVPETFAKAWHMCTNATTYLDGDRAHGTTAFTFYCIDDGVPKFALGHYADAMMRVGSTWLFSRRKVQFDVFCNWQDGFASGAPLGAEGTR